jgi:hypothetical protein
MRRRVFVGLLCAGVLLCGAGMLAPRLTRSVPLSPPAVKPPPALSPQPARATPGPARLKDPRAVGAGNPAAGPRQRGVALGLFAEDVSFDYAPLLAEIAALGATHVALVVPLYQDHGASTALTLHTRFSPTLGATAEAVRAARRAGLEVTLFPIVRLLHPRAPNEWRGTLAPADVDAWFESYGGHIGDLAALGAMTGATRLVVGSELSSLDGDHDRVRWARLIARTREIFPGLLVYSANWDHYRDAAVLDLVDEAGVVAYFDLRRADGPADVAALEQRWRQLRAELAAWRQGKGRPQPFVFTEVGYRSRADATAAPWDETSGGTPDLEEQRRGFEAFRRAWTTPAAALAPPTPTTPTSGAPGEDLDLAGLYVWNWYGWGGPGTVSYTPRGKPAAAEISRLFEAM